MRKNKRNFGIFLLYLPAIVALGLALGPIVSSSTIFSEQLFVGVAITSITMGIGYPFVAIMGINAYHKIKLQEKEIKELKEIETEENEKEKLHKQEEIIDNYKILDIEDDKKSLFQKYIYFMSNKEFSDYDDKNHTNVEEKPRVLKKK